MYITPIRPHIRSRELWDAAYELGLTAACAMWSDDDVLIYAAELANYVGDLSQLTSAERCVVIQQYEQGAARHYS